VTWTIEDTVTLALGARPRPAVAARALRAAAGLDAIEAWICHGALPN